MELEQVKQLIALLEKSKLAKLSFKKGDFEVSLEKPSVVERVVAPAPAVEHLPERLPESVPHRVVAPVAEGQLVTSPMVGTYYARPSPDQPQFVKVGDKVQENTVVCIIEAMKVMNEVKAGKAGTVVEIYADNGQPMEFGGKILRIK